MQRVVHCFGNQLCSVAAQDISTYSGSELQNENQSQKHCKLIKTEKEFSNQLLADKSNI